MPVSDPRLRAATAVTWGWDSENINLFPKVG
jgi:hypothetical protein